MEFARRKTDGELVFAEDYLYKNVSPYGFCCPCDECALELMLKSDKYNNISPPYFAKLKRRNYIKKCPFNNQRNSKKTTTNGINTSYLFPHIIRATSKV